MIILTGFLGAGKTTLLNRFLRSPIAAGTAVLVNEFGAIDVDGAILSESLSDGSPLISLPNGCVCCAVQEDLAAALDRLKQPFAGGSIKRCIIETTGLANPGSIVRGVGHDPRFRKSLRIEQIVTVFAADQIGHLGRFPEVARQIGSADRIVLSKTDLVSNSREAVDAIKAMNPLACVHEVIAGVLDATALINAPEQTALPREVAVGHGHDHDISTFTIQVNRPLDPDRFRDVMSFLIMRYAEQLLRIKGIVCFYGESSPHLLNGVHDVFNSEPVEGGGWTDRNGAIVFIGTDLPEAQIRRDVESCLSDPPG